MKTCFGLSLQTGVQYIAAIDIVRSIVRKYFDIFQKRTEFFRFVFTSFLVLLNFFQINSILIVIVVVTVQEWHYERLVVILLESVNVIMGSVLACGACKV